MLTAKVSFKQLRLAPNTYLDQFRSKVQHTLAHILSQHVGDLKVDDFQFDLNYDSDVQVCFATPQEKSKDKAVQTDPLPV